jgi:hypothetical protein
MNYRLACAASRVPSTFLLRLADRFHRRKVPLPLRGGSLGDRGGVGICGTFVVATYWEESKRERKTATSSLIEIIASS